MQAKNNLTDQSDFAIVAEEGNKMKSLQEALNTAKQPKEKKKHIQLEMDESFYNKCSIALKKNGHKWQSTLHKAMELYLAEEESKKTAKRK